METIRDRENILERDVGETLAVRFYRRTPVTSTYLVVPYREMDSTDGFVLTAYVARRLARGRTRLWTG